MVGPDLEIEIAERLPPVETTFDGELVAAMGAALKAEDPGARPAGLVGQVGQMGQGGMRPAAGRGLRRPVRAF